jgi:hypothetical protein
MRICLENSAKPCRLGDDITRGRFLSTGDSGPLLSDLVILHLLQAYCTVEGVSENLPGFHGIQGCSQLASYH